MRVLCCLLLASAPVVAEDSNAKEKPQVPPALTEGCRTYFSIDPKNRSADIVQAFDHLRKDKPTLKIMIKTSSGAILTNVSEITASTGGTLLFVRVPSNQGARIQVIPTDEFEEIAYSP